MEKKGRGTVRALAAVLLVCVLTGTAGLAGCGAPKTAETESKLAGTVKPADVKMTENPITAVRVITTPAPSEKKSGPKAGDAGAVSPVPAEGNTLIPSSGEGHETSSSSAQDGMTPSSSAQDGMTASSSEQESAASSSPEQQDMVSASQAEEAPGAADAEAEEGKPAADTVRGIVAIDPGHQAPSVDMSATEPNGPGSSEMKMKATAGTRGSYTGIGEYELNMDISLLLRDELERRGYEVVLTREDNETAISNSERAVMANESGADIYIRIHANGSDDPGISGALALSPGYDNPYVSHLAEKSEELAKDILDSYCEKTGMKNLGVSYSNTMTGINWSEIPVMVLEMGFMTNELDDNQMAGAEFRDLMTAGIADGVDLWFDNNPSPSEGTPRKTLGGRPVGEKGQTEAGAAWPETAEMKALGDTIRNEEIAPAEAAGESWGVTVVDLKDGQRCSVNGDRRIRSASVLKLFIMAANYDRLYRDVPEEERAETRVDEGNLAGLLKAMITVSDNDAANTLVAELGGGDFEAGRAVLNDWCREHGYSGTSMGRRFLASSFTEDNYTTADDCALLLASVYEGTCVSPAASEQMLALLKEQTRLNKIPAGVSAYGVRTANKTGELADPTLGVVENDAAIVWGPVKDYVLCTLSENLASNGGGISRIVSISDLVYRRLNLEGQAQTGAAAGE